MSTAVSNNSTTSTTAPPKGRSKPPSLLACIPCRKSHLKCDGQKPLCSRCADRNGECFWIESRRGYREFRKPQSTTTDEKRERPSKNDAIFNESQSPRGHTGDQSLDEADPSKIRALTYEELFPTFVSVPLVEDSQPAQSQKEMHSPSNRSDSTMSIARELDSAVVSKTDIESTDLIELFYRHFYHAHPFVVPRKMYLQNPASLPTHLRVVIRYLASHYLPQANHAALEKAANVIFSDEVPDDGYKVQGQLLFAMVRYARFDQEEGAIALDKAIELAIRIGLNRNSYALQYGQGDATLQESWRRTWWTLMIVEGLVTVIGGQSQPYRLYSTFTDVALPGHDEDYDELRASPFPRSVADLRNRTFSEDTFNYSSFAYGVEAAYILGSVLALGPDTFAVTDPQVEAIDTSISNFLLSLPLDKREIMRHDGTVDECLLVAHLVINWAAIGLHRPRSTLTFIRNHYRTTCTRAEAAGLPALTYASHTAKALRAANAITDLASVRRHVANCTPVLMCGITTAATVHLPAYAIVDRPDQATAIKERLQLGISALASFGEIWPRASIAKGQVAKFAREVLMKPNVCVDSTGPGMMPKISTEPMPQLEYEVPFNNDVWMENLIQAEQDVDEPTVCGAFGDFVVPQVPGA
ncbi:uncharacterized protein Z518_04259 [Rhinocladiella mackenziei CBS 650.93]|uniref:Zn(2)-C6 fungal-type domain-containing protein n=1 Tax=Rhinocladiella mackenziei CBS 650.93 TaxID=1442369 RepID=A0A0D2IKP2_9EURO|nr:uncharacterized protein Z518_04259 [Rhinocladiella mackenziei CBS 650.93]KIX06284.1 hypothetical protein Z518_04259 [Rhinocladiella mackenziei CBS 650.93]